MSLSDEKYTYCTCNTFLLRKTLEVTVLPSFFDLVKAGFEVSLIETMHARSITYLKYDSNVSQYWDIFDTFNVNVRHGVTTFKLIRVPM